MSRLLRKAYIPLLQIAVVVGLIVLWQVASTRGWIDRRVWSSPTEVWEKFTEWVDDGTLWREAAVTLRVVAIGYVLGVIGGVILGIVIGVSHVFRSYAEPFLVFFSAVPRSLLVPFLIAWLGFGMTPKIIHIVLVIIPMIVVTVAAGVATMDKNIVSNAQVLGASRRRLVRDVYMPAAGVWILGSAQVSVGYAFQAAILAEFVGAFAGIGYLVMSGRASGDPETVFVAIGVVMVIAIAIDRILAAVGRRTTRWMPSQLGRDG